MPDGMLDRFKLRLSPLRERANRVRIEDTAVGPDEESARGDAEFRRRVGAIAARMQAAREGGRPLVFAFGAHSVKSGLAPLFQWLMAQGWATHLATNGAGIIHDWEFAFLGASSEDVRANVREGRFGLWEETGFHLNLALLLGAWDGLGYGEAVGRLIESGFHAVPDRAALRAALGAAERGPECAARAAAAADLLERLERAGVSPGRIEVPHAWRRFSIQAAAYRSGIPFTGHPMIGHDIIYTHPLCSGAAIGRAAERDFLRFAGAISRLEGGVYVSIGSAVMSPMIFEKSFSMAQNLALQEGRSIERHAMVVVDLVESQWDWARGEPPESAPEYYLRFCKTFSRMGGSMSYVSAHSRDFLLALIRALRRGE